MKYAFIEAHRAQYAVPAMCELLGVSRSGYHAWRGRGPSPREQENVRLVGQIRAIHDASDGNYGSPRVHEELRDQGKVVSLNRVRRLMKKNNIAARHKKKFRATTDSRHNLPVAPNLLGQEFVAERPDQVWLADVTYVWTDEGWLYLACVLDLYSRLVVGWAMSERNDRQLVIAALGMAYFQRRPARGLVHHSDRGSVPGFKWSSQQRLQFAERSTSSSASAGVCQPSVLRGLVLSASATAARWLALCLLKSVPFGKYCRSNPFVFSLVPRCHGLCGSQK